jgi:hypothetical protein
MMITQHSVLINNYRMIKKLSPAHAQVIVCIRDVQYYRNIGILQYKVQQYYIAICFFNTGIYDM